MTTVTPEFCLDDMRWRADGARGAHRSLRAMQAANPNVVIEGYRPLGTPQWTPPREARYGAGAPRHLGTSTPRVIQPLRMTNYGVKLVARIPSTRLGGPRKYDWDWVLFVYAAGDLTLNEMARVEGMPTMSTLVTILDKSRERGDPRAAPRNQRRIAA